jgi:hypothetical protein
MECFVTKGRLLASCSGTLVITRYNITPYAKRPSFSKRSYIISFRTTFIIYLFHNLQSKFIYSSIMFTMFYYSNQKLVDGLPDIFFKLRYILGQ